MIKDVAVGNALWRGCCRDVRVGLAEYVAVLEPCRRGTEDKVGSALDIAVLEVEARVGVACVDCVLMTKKTAVVRLM